MKTTRVYGSYRQISGPDGYLANQTPFRGNTMSAAFEGDDYVVYSYRTEIGRVQKDGTVILNDTHYSVTTSKHQGYVRAWLGYNHKVGKDSKCRS